MSKNWQRSDVFSTVAIVVSVFFSILTVVLNAREDPSLMPYGQNVFGNRLALDFNNFSKINLHDVSILILGFNNQLDTIPSFRIQDKFLFTISSKSTVNYSFSIGRWALNDFYFRARLKGNYNSRFPYWPREEYEQVIWYSGNVLRLSGDSVNIRLWTTHKDQIDSLQVKWKLLFHESDKRIDQRFQN